MPSEVAERIARVATGLWEEGFELATFYATRVALVGRPLPPETEQEAWTRLRSLAALWREAEQLGLEQVDEVWRPKLVEMVAGVEDSLLLVLLKPGEEDASLVDLDDLVEEAEAVQGGSA